MSLLPLLLWNGNDSTTRGSGMGGLKTLKNLKKNPKPRKLMEATFACYSYGEGFS